MSPARLLSTFCLCLLLTACASSGGGRATPRAAALPRADPGYVQWLERQAFLGTAGEYTDLITGSELPWRASSAADTVDTLLTAAPTWLLVHPLTLMTGGTRPVFAELADPSVLRLLKEIRLHGLYIAPSGESGTIWEYRREASSTGEDVTSPTWAAHMGGEKDFQRLAGLAEQEGVQLGADLVPAATGMGPDFFLAARNVRDYPGCYVMVEIPENLWSLLPQARQEWSGAPLTKDQVARLAEKHLLPPALAREFLPWAMPGGWAATREVDGSDGVRRRWVYRYQKTPDRPVLNWDDPSGAGRKIFSAAAIRQIGVLRQTLGGLRMEALCGLDAALQTQTKATLEPAPSALHALGREIRRYGGWSAQRDLVPPEHLSRILRTGVDFTADTVTMPAAEYALLTGDAEPLKASLAAALADNLDQRRLLRTLPATGGLSLRPFQSTVFSSDIRQKLAAALSKHPAWKQAVPLRGDTLYATAATLAAIAADLTPDQAAGATSRASILQRHLLLTTFRAGLPGLLMLSGQDLAGVLSTASSEDAPEATTLGAWGFSEISQAGTRQGVSRAPTAYAPPLEQLSRDGTYVRAVAHLAALRDTHRIASGTVIGLGRTIHPGSAAVFTRLPGGNLLLTAANFSDASSEENLTLPQSGGTRRAEDLLRGGDVAVSGREINLVLAPWECRLILLHTGV